MLLNWYFCACLAHSGDDTKAVLSIVDTLEDREPEAVALGIALSELQRADVWTRLYALRGVLRALASGVLTEADKTIAQSLVHEAASAVSAAGAWADLARGLGGSGNPTARVSLMQSCAEGLLQSDSPPLTATPYLDLPGQSGAVLVLAALCERMRTGERQVWTEVLERDDAGLRRLVGAAIDLRFGRLPFRLAVEALRLAGLGLDVATLARKAARAGLVDLEPDLLALIVDAMPEHHAHVDALVAEARQLTQWRGLWQALRGTDPGPETREQLLRRLGLLVGPQSPPPNLLDALRKDTGLALWQSSLWMAAARRAPSDALSAFAIQWQRPGREREGPDIGSPWQRVALQKSHERYVMQADLSSAGALRAAGAAHAIVGAVRATADRGVPPQAGLFLLHACDVLDALGSDVSEALSNLRGATTRHVGRLGARYLPLDEVVELIEQIGDGDRDSRILRTRATAGLISWFLDAYRRATKGAPEFTWLDLAASLVQLARNVNVGGVDRVRAACVHRFFCDAHSLAFADLDWSRGTDWPMKNPRQLFLLPDLPGDEWYRPWPEPRPLNPRDENQARTFLLFRATERVSALESTTDAIRRDEARPKWREMLLGIDHLGTVDRLYLLRLIEIVDARQLDDDDRLSMALVVVALGSAYEVHCLLTKIYGDGHPLPELRLSMVRALVERLDYEREATTHREHPEPVDYREDRMAAVQVVRDWVARLASPQAGDADIRAQLLSCRAEVRRRHATAWRRVEFEVEHRNGKSQLKPRDGQRPFEIPILHGAALDVRAQMATVMVEDRSRLSAVDGLFHGVAWQDMDRCKAIGVVVSVKEAGDRFHAEFQIGGRHIVGVTCTERPQYKQGDWISVPLIKDAKRNTVVDGTRALDLLPRRFVGGELAEAAVKATAPHGGGLATPLVTIAGNALSLVNRNNPQGWIDLQHWAGEPGRTRLSSLQTPLLARCAGNGEWLPANEDRVGLLASLPQGVKEFSLVWLGLDDRDEAGRPAWLFGAGPGERFALGAPDIGTEGMAMLEAARNVLSPLRRAVAPPRQVALERDVRVNFEVRADGRLGITGFDPSPLKWRDLFAVEQHIVATRDADGWTTTLPAELPTGFAPRINVAFGRQPPADVRQVNATVTEWKPLRGVVTAQLMQARSLRGVEAEWVSFCSWWLNLNRDSIQSAALGSGVVRLRRILWATRFGDGLVAETEAGPLVELPTEEWSLDVQQRSGAQTSVRDAVVESVGEWRTLHGFDAVTVLEGGPPRDGSSTALPMGMLAEVPDFGGTMWTVVSPSGQTKSPVSRIRVAGAESERVWPRLGDRVVFTHREGVLKVKVQRRTVRVRPLWTIVEDDLDSRGSSCFVLAVSDGRSFTERAVHQTAPGRLASSPTPPQVDWEGRLTPVRDPYTSGRGRLQRAIAEVDDGHLVANASLGSWQRDGLATDRYRFRMNTEATQVTQTAWVVRRYFVDLEPVAARPTPSVGSEPRSLEKAARQAQVERLESLLSNQVPVDIAMADRGVRIDGIPLPDPERPNDPCWLSLFPNHRPFVERTEGRRGVAVLRRDAQGCVKASVRGVPALLNVEGWYQSTAPRTARSGGIQDDSDEPLLNQVLDLGALSLFYVGPEGADPLTGDVHPGGPLHRFEWAPGGTVLLPAALLLFAGRPFATVENVLFHGDEIRQVMLHPESGQLQLDVIEVGLKPSEGRQLHWQAKHLRLVHLLTIRRTIDDELAVEKVEGLAERSLSQDPHVFRPHARIADDASEVKRSLRDDVEGSVHGRLKLDVYEKSFGKDIVFDPVWMTFERGGLEVGERLFLTVDELQERGNDYCLCLKLPEEVVARDGARPRVEVWRRSFSVREDVLRRLFRHDRHCLDGRLLLVEVRRPQRPMGNADMSIDAHVLNPHRVKHEGPTAVPGRRAESLKGWLRDSEELTLVAVVASSDALVALEVRPGVFVRVDRRDIELLPGASLESGAVLLLRLGTEGGPAQFLASSAVPSDAELVPDGGRGVSVLPLDHLGKKSVMQHAAYTDDWWSEWKSFTAEGLPNVVASARSNSSSRRDFKQEIVSLLKIRPPRPGWLFSDAARFFIDPDWYIHDCPVRLRIAGSDAKLQAWPWDEDAGGVDVDWRLISYADQPARQIANQARSWSWRAHDNHSVRWVNDDEIARDRLAPRTSLTGPVFAESWGKGPRLRYTPAAQPRFAFPPRELTDGFSGTGVEAAQGQAPGGWWLSVASVDFKRRRLVVEASPGRLIVVPVSVLVLREDVGRERSLEDLATNAIGVGDEICLGLSPGTPASVDRIRLLGWKPSGRAALSARRMILVVGDKNIDDGAITLGKGLFQVVIPMSTSELAIYQPGHALLVDRDNRLDYFDAQDLADFGALLSIDERDQVVVDGLPGFVWRKDPRAPWDQDPLAPEFLNEHKLKRLICAAGGSLPVTIGGMDKVRKIVSISRSRQLGTLQEGLVGQACALGRLDEETVLARVGRLLLPLRFGSLVCGLPKDAAGPAMSALAKDLMPLWVRGGPDGSVMPGTDPRDPGTPFGSFSPMLHVEVGGVDQARGGFLCRCVTTQAMHWLPAERAAWIDLSSRPVRIEAFLRANRRLRAAVDGGSGTLGALSVIDHPLASSEFAGLRVGRQVAVMCVELEGPDQHLVRSVVSGVLLLDRGTRPGVDRAGDAVWTATVRHRDVGRQRIIESSPVQGGAIEFDLPRRFAELLQPQVLDHGQEGQGSDWIDALAAIDEVLSEVAQGNGARARKRFQDLARRALRGWHTELIGDWLQTQVGLKNYGPWSRLNRLRPILGDTKQPSKSTRDQLDAFCRSVELGRGPSAFADLVALAAAVRAASGDLTSDAEAAIECAPVSQRLVALARLDPPDARELRSPLPQSFLDELQALRQLLSQRGRKLLFGRVLPPIDPAAFRETE